MHRDDPAYMSIDERLDEVASLLATGFLRLKQRTAPSSSGVAGTWSDSGEILANRP